MRQPSALVLAAGILLAAAPFVPAFSIPFFVFGWESSCSLFDLARASHASASGTARDADFHRATCGVCLMERWGFDGRPEVMAFLLLAGLCGFAMSRRLRFAWVLGVLVAAVAVWTWRGLRAAVVGFVGEWPGGTAGFIIRPWPWLLVGAATLALVAASWWARRIGRPPATQAVRKIFE